MARALALLALSSTCHAAAIRVPDGFPSIQEAIDAAAQGDVVVVEEGTYPEWIVLKEGVSVRGSGAEVTVINGSGGPAVVVGASSCEISGFTISGPGDLDVDGVYCEDVQGFSISHNIIRDHSWSGIDAVRSSVLVANNLIIHNRVAGIFCLQEQAAETIIVNNTICGNENEAGINVWQGASVVALNNIIARNTGAGGVFCNGGSAALMGNDVWGNTCHLPPCSDYVGCAPGEGDISLDPLFADPDGGDYTLQEGSPCIDAGQTEGAPSSDIRFRPRPCGEGVDMGAYESCGRDFARADCNDDGGVDISDGVCILAWLFLGGPLPGSGCLPVANTNGDEKIDLSDAVYLLTHLFVGGPPPSAPYPGCGPGVLAADAAMGCEVAPASCR